MLFGWRKQTPVADLAAGFLSRWSPREAWTLAAQGTARTPDVRSFLPPAATAEAKAWIADKQRRGMSLLLFVGRTETPMHQPIGDHHVIGSQHIAISLPGRPAQAFPAIKGMPFPPTAVIDTGRSVVAIWSLRQPVPTATAVALGAALGERCGGALAWLVPVPGTRRGTGEQVTLMSHDPTRLYTPAELGAKANSPLRVRRASEVRERAIDWMWRHMIARDELTIIAGFGSAGKTTLCLSLAAIVSRGQPFPDGTRAPRGGVLVIEGEDDIETVTKPRLIAAGADLDRVHIVDQTRDMLTPVVLDDAARGVEDLRLVVLSPLRRLIRDNQASNDIVRERLEPLIGWAKARHVGMIGVMHPQKGNRSASADALAGSAAYTELSRMVHLAGVDETDPETDLALRRRELRVIKTNNAPPGIRYGYRIDSAMAGDIETSRVVWLADAEDARHCGTDAPRASGTAARAAPAPVAHAASPAPLAEAAPGNVVAIGTPAERWLRRALAQGPRPAAEVKALAPTEGVPVRSLHRGADRLGVVRYRDNGTQMWRLP